MRLQGNAALLVIDVQKGFDSAAWGRRNNPAAERNILALCDMWQATGRPIIAVRHTSQKRLSPLAAWSPGRGFKPQLVHIRFDLQIDKEVNSAFLGKPSLDAWLKARSVNQIITTGVQTNMCVESTARMGSNLGYEIILPLDATYTFDIKTLEGVTLTADHISQVTAANMVRGGFARVVSSADILGSYTPTRNAPEHGQDNSSNEDVQ